MSALEERKAETREIITRAARKVFSEKGYYKAQISDIVKEAGISVGSIYAHFHDKRDLFVHISKENLETLRIRLKELRQTQTPGDVIERIRRAKYTYNAFFDYVDENPQQVLMILRGGFGVDEDHDTDVWDSFNAFAHDIADDFRKWEKLGFIKGGNATIMGHITIGMSLNVVHSYLVDKQFSRSEAINNLIAMNYAMYSIYLTDKGKQILGGLSVSQILEDEEA